MKKETNPFPKTKLQWLWENMKGCRGIYFVGMAGTVVYAAEGKFPPEEVANILARGDRKAAGPTVPPGGALYDAALV